MVNVIDQLLIGHKVHEEEHLLEPCVRIDEHNIGKTFHLVLAAYRRSDTFFVEIPKIDKFAFRE